MLCQKNALFVFSQVMLTWGVLKNVSQVVQRVVFLHEDLMKLPSFPRKALEAELDLYANGEMGKASCFSSSLMREKPGEEKAANSLCKKKDKLTAAKRRARVAEQ